MSAVVFLHLRCQRQEDHVFKVILNYIASSGTAWATRGPISKSWGECIMRFIRVLCCGPFQASRFRMSLADICPR